MMEPQFAPSYITPYGIFVTNRKTAPWFVGNYIHNASALAWHQQKKQRVSRHTRQRPHHTRTMKKPVAEGRQSTRHPSESGYETVGEQPSFSSSSSSSSSKMGPTTVRVHACNSNNSDGNSSNRKSTENATLQRLMKDLHRCDVFIARSLSALNQVSW